MVRTGDLSHVVKETLLVFCLFLSTELVGRGALLIEANFDVPPATENPTWTHSGSWNSEVTLNGGIASYNTIDNNQNVSILTPVGSMPTAEYIVARMRVLDDDGFNGGGTSINFINNGFFFTVGIVPQNLPFHPQQVVALSGGSATATFPLDTSNFHEIGLEVTDLATGKYDIYVDGTPVLLDNQASGGGAGFDGQVQFGDNEGTADAEAELDWIRVYDELPTTPGLPDTGWHSGVDWHDDFYQYRIPFDVAAVPSAGQYIVPITEAEIVDAINAASGEEVKYVPDYFAFDNVLVVEHDASGNVIGVPANSGYFMTEISANKVNNPGFESTAGGLPTGWNITVPAEFSVANNSYNGSNALNLNSTFVDLNGCFQHGIPVTPGRYLMMTFWAKTLATEKCPDVHLVDDIANQYIESSDYPLLLSRTWAQHQRLYKPDFINARIRMYRLSVGETLFDDFSVKEVAIDLAVEASSAGDKYYMLYYQPTEGQTYNIPTQTLPSLPPQTFSGLTLRDGGAGKYLKDTAYRLQADPDFDLYFAETTLKIGPNSVAPTNDRPAVQIACAANELQSFQIVLDPKGNVSVDTVVVSNLVSPDDTIPSGACTVHRLDYVDMTQPSADNGHILVPRITDPMVPFTTQAMTSGDDPLSLWITVEVDKNRVSGDYTGMVSISGTASAQPFTVDVPLNLRVYNFRLPDKPTFRNIAGGTLLYFVGTGGSNSPFDFHGITSDTDKDALVELYYDVMGKSKAYPQYPNLRDGMWFGFDYPPQGLNVDAPGNFFSVYNFNFADMNPLFGRMLDDRNANAFMVHATNGDIANTWSLPSGAGVVGWGPYGNYANEITQTQFEHLVRDIFHEVALNLQNNGWLEYALILVDETSNEGYSDKLHVFIDALKADPLASQIKLVNTINNTTAFSYRDTPSDPQAKYASRLDIWAPENEQQYSGIADYYFPDTGMGPDDYEAWRYYTRTAHLIIDTPGLNNRNMPMKNYFMGSTGTYKWELIYWDFPNALVQNPWVDPFSFWGNGTVSFFYPPLKTGVSATPNFTVTPSVRLAMWREGVEDYEYLHFLENLIVEASAKSIDTTAAQAAIDSMGAMVDDQVHWSVNDEFYLRMRNEIAEQIESLIGEILLDDPVTIADSIEGQDLRIDFDGTGNRRYILNRQEAMTGPAWQEIDTEETASDGPVTMYDPDATVIYPEAYYRLELEHPDYQ